MPPISTKIHGAADYATAAALIAAPKILRGEDRLAAAVLRGAGVGTLVTSALTDYEFGLVRKLPMRAHLVIDAGTGALLAGAGAALRARGGKLSVLIRFAALGVGELAGAALTQRHPGDRPAGPGGAVGDPPAATEPPADPASARAETLAAGAMDYDPLVAHAESEAAAAAGAIGGTPGPLVDDPAMDPVYQAGGGEEEGFEAAEQELIEHATHAEPGGDPTGDAFAPEVESDRATAVYGQDNALSSTEVLEDPAAGADDPGAGPDVSADRAVGTQTREGEPGRVE